MAASDWANRIGQRFVFNHKIPNTWSVIENCKWPTVMTALVVCDWLRTSHFYIRCQLVYTSLLFQSPCRSQRSSITTPRCRSKVKSIINSGLLELLIWTGTMLLKMTFHFWFYQHCLYYRVDWACRLYWFWAKRSEWVSEWVDHSTIAVISGYEERMDPWAQRIGNWSGKLVVICGN